MAGGRIAYGRIGLAVAVKVRRQRRYRRNEGHAYRSIQGSVHEGNLESFQVDNRERVCSPADSRVAGQGPFAVRTYGERVNSEQLAGSLGGQRGDTCAADGDIAGAVYLQPVTTGFVGFEMFTRYTEESPKFEINAVCPSGVTATSRVKPLVLPNCPSRNGPYTVAGVVLKSSVTILPRGGSVMTAQGAAERLVIDDKNMETTARRIKCNTFIFPH